MREQAEVEARAAALPGPPSHAIVLPRVTRCSAPADRLAAARRTHGKRESESPHLKIHKDINTCPIGSEQRTDPTMGADTGGLGGGWCCTAVRAARAARLAGEGRTEQEASGLVRHRLCLVCVHC